MRCLNPDCSSVSANEVNISVNVSDCAPETPEPEYTGYTTYGGHLEMIGTSCHGDPDSCGRTTLIPDWQEQAIRFIGAECGWLTV